ncbi:MAG TPA: glycosyltransferase family 4 protein [Actinomycetota bacterium]|nr:glycosyltransferase family 4 protein [Actinomycetota bacterium]
MEASFVVQRYGPEVVGGAESACRELALRLAATGAGVTVLTTCATDAATWANRLPPGESADGPVAVLRFPTAAERDPGFEQLSRRLFAHEDPPRSLQQRWVRAQGPFAPGLVEEIRSRAGEPDVWVFYTYLYHPTLAGLPLVAARAVLHPALHEEAPARLPLVAEVVRSAAALSVQTPEEWELVLRTVGWPPSKLRMIGMGVQEGEGDVEAFRRRAGLDGEPYLLSLGRVGEGKGTDRLARMFAAFKRRHPGPLKLVLAGPVVQAPPEADGVVVTGVLSDAERWGALRGCCAFVHPSPLESFAIVLIEAWMCSKPALVNGWCRVTSGHARRARAGLEYRDYAEFEAALEVLLGDPRGATAIGANGLRYAERYRWEPVIARYRSLLEEVAAGAVRPGA